MELRKEGMKEKGIKESCKEGIGEELKPLFITLLSLFYSLI